MKTSGYQGGQFLWQITEMSHKNYEAIPDSYVVEKI